MIEEKGVIIGSESRRIHENESVIVHLGMSGSGGSKDPQKRINHYSFRHERIGRVEGSSVAHPAQRADS